MSVVSVKRDVTGSTIDVDRDANISYGETWIIETTGINTTIAEVRQASGLPAQGSAHPDDSTLYALSIAIRRETINVWKAVVTYDSVTKQTGDPTDPVSRLPDWSLGYEYREKELQQDAQSETLNPTTAVGVYVVNTAQDPFENAPTVDEPLPLLSVRYNVSTLSLSTVNGIVNHVNNDVFLGQPAKSVLCRAIRADGPFFAYQTSYVQLGVEFLIDTAKLHRVHLLSQGYYEGLVASKRRIKDATDNREITVPANLDESGNSGTTAFELKWNRYPATSFAPFGLSLANLTGLTL